MSEPALIRRFQPGDEAALFHVYFTAIHLVASRDYTAQQIQAWAPPDVDPVLWSNKMRAINPFVAQSRGGELVGYADLQTNGYIDHFFVSGEHPRRGIGSLLMAKILERAAEAGASLLTSHVSRTAEPFFSKFGFIVIERRFPDVRGVVIPNASMCRRLQRG